MGVGLTCRPQPAVGASWPRIRRTVIVSMSSNVVPEIRVAAGCGAPRGGLLITGRLTAPCALGRSGIRPDKREGDGATPAGAFRLVEVLYRPDRTVKPRTALPSLAIRPDSGWCDDPGSRFYNRPVCLPFAASHERLWRDDRLYDLLVVLDYNLAFPRRGRGSAIFLHLAAPDFLPTAGCIAIGPTAMRRLLAVAGPSTRLVVGRL